MDEGKKYAAVRIPQREAPPQRAEQRPAGAGLGAGAAFRQGIRYAEIEYEFKADGPTGGGYVQMALPGFVKSQPIGKRAIDPVSEKIYNMRRLASGNPFAKNDSSIFYGQAKFMEDFVDDYPGKASFFMYYPYYQHMRYEQLRTYFTWRANVRNGVIGQIAYSYVFLYIYELLSCVGVGSPAEGLESLMLIWNSYREFEPSLDKYMPRWLKDFNIYYDMPFGFREFVDKYRLRKFYPETFIFDPDEDGILDLWNAISAYDITKSKFFGANNGEMMRECFSRVLRGIKKLCESRGAPLEDLFIYGVYNGVNWRPFQQAVFHSWLNQPDRSVEMPNRERYYCRDNKWTADITIYFSGAKEFAGYVIKKTEAQLRQAVKYNHKIAADRGAMLKHMQKLNDIGITITELDREIVESVNSFHSDMSRTIVKVDYTNLDKIRREASSTRDRLIVPDESAELRNLFSEPRTELQSDPRPVMLSDPQLAMLSDPRPSMQSDPPDIQYDEWTALKDALSASERKALKAILGGGADLKAFADENDIMLEVLVDNINEKASDIIGDNIMEIDGEVSIYGDYADKVAELAEFLQ